MAGMVSLKLSPSERRAEQEEWTNPKPPEYPWGLRLDLDKDAMSKLGLGRVEVGQEFNIVAKAVVTGYRDAKDEYGDSTSTSLQVTDMGLEPANAADRPRTADIMFKDG